MFLLHMALTEVTGWYSVGGGAGLEGPRQLHPHVWCLGRVACKAGLSGVSDKALIRSFSIRMVSGWSDILWSFRAPRKKKFQIEVSSFSKLSLEIDTASLPMYYTGQSSYRAQLDSGARGLRPTSRLEYCQRMCGHFNLPKGNALQDDIGKV